MVEELRRLGHDVLTTLEAGNAGTALPDEAVLSLASAENRILITLNRRHFIRLHSVNSGHQGIIVCTVDPDFTAQAHRIHVALKEAGLMEGKLVRINRPA